MKTPKKPKTPVTIASLKKLSDRRKFLLREERNRSKMQSLELYEVTEKNSDLLQQLAHVRGELKRRVNFEETMATRIRTLFEQSVTDDILVEIVKPLLPKALENLCLDLLQKEAQMIKANPDLRTKVRNLFAKAAGVVVDQRPGASMDVGIE